MSIRKIKASPVWVTVIVFALGLAACASTPPPSGSAPPGPDPALAQALEEAKTEAAKQQKMAEDFGGPDYAAADYQQAQSLAAEARGLNPVGAEDYTAATEKYKAVADAFRGVSGKSMSPYFEAKAQAVREAREKAVGAGAGQEGIWKEGADQLAPPDKEASDAEGLYNSQDYYGAAGSYDNALNQYGIVETEAQCYTLKAQIEQHNMQGYDPDTYNQGEGNLEKALAAYNNKDFAGAKTAADAALSSYRTVADAGWEKLAAEQAAAAQAQRNKALEIKADVAMKDDCDAADAAYSQGEEETAQRAFKPAYDNFSQALTTYTSVYNQVLTMRQSADTVIKQADKKVSESGERLKVVQPGAGGSPGTGPSTRR